jgi:hypothetical protein
MNKNNKIQQNKKALIKALEKSMGIVTNACKIVGIDRTTFYRYYKQDEEFKEAVDSIEDYAIDYVESKLFENIKDKKETSIIFYLKTKGKKRGYIEKTEQDITTKGESIKSTPVIKFIQTDDK